MCETLKVMQQVEDVLRRTAGGLNANKLLTPKDLLVLCHTLISQNAKFLKQVPKAPQRGKGKRDAVVELKRRSDGRVVRRPIDLSGGSIRVEMVDEVDEVVCHVSGAERVQEVTRVWLRDGETENRFDSAQHEMRMLECNSRSLPQQSSRVRSLRKHSQPLSVP